jgi:hypothetical protein
MARPRRGSLGALFVVLAAAFAAVTVWAALGGAWIVAVAAGVLGAWMAEQAYRSLR